MTWRGLRESGQGVVFWVAVPEKWGLEVARTQLKTIGTTGTGGRMYLWVSNWLSKPFSKKVSPCLSKFFAKILGYLLRRRLIKAMKELNDQEEGLRIFENNQQLEAPGWKQMVREFELGESTKNPFSWPKGGKFFFI